MSSPDGTASGTDGGAAKIGMPFDAYEELGGSSHLLLEDYNGPVMF